MVSATPTPEPTRAPRPALATPSAGPEREPEVAPTPTPRAEPTRAPAPVALPPLAETPSPAATLPAGSAPQPAPASSGSALWWLLAALAAAAITAAAIFARRRAAADEAEPVVEPYEPADIPLGAPPTPSPVLTPPPAKPAAPNPAPAAPFDIALQPVRLSVSLVNATLHYELTISNRSGQPLGPVFVAADMIGAHASIPEDSQLARDGSGLELRYEIAGLAPGETARVKGDLRLPLAAVTPIRSGSATLLVPLVRVRAEAPGLSETRVLVVGEPSSLENGRLRPFRLDAGPRIFGAVDQRDVSAAA